MLIMLLLLGIIDFLLIGVKTADDQPDNELKTFIEMLNNMRREVANRFGIGNMHELKYDHSLFLIAQNPKWRDFQQSDTRQSRFFGIPNFDTAIGHLENRTKNFEIWDDKKRSDIVKTYESSKVDEWEHVNPLQRKIGCSPNDDSIICIIGPETNLSDYNTRNDTPGSKCLERYENDDGLCVMDTMIEIPPPIDPDSDQADFISKLNAARKTCAKEDSIEEMQELVYDETLVDIANSLNWQNEDFAGARKTWRYTMFKTYDGGVEELMDATRQWDSLKEEKKMKNFNDGIKTYFKPYEHIFPRQNKIGCVMKQGLPDDNEVLCLLGPEGKIDPMKKVIKATTATVAPPPPPKVTVSSVQPFPEDPKVPEPKTTEKESELARRIAEWKAKEIDGDEYDDEFPTTPEESFSFSISIFFVFMIVWVI